MPLWRLVFLGSFREASEVETESMRRSVNVAALLTEKD
jgi:hypothetical protein